MNKNNIVLLPGYDGDGQYTFPRLIFLLTPKFNCYPINYPYLHHTDRTYNLAQLVACIHDQIAKQGIDKFHLLGFSMGGFVASAYAHKYPIQIKSLTLTSSSPILKINSTYSSLIKLAKIGFRSRLIASLFTSIYRLKQLKWLTNGFPLPAPPSNFPIREGYPLFGTLANVLSDSRKFSTTELTSMTTLKLSILFDDDHSFPANLYSKILQAYDFKVRTFVKGGHAESKDYWDIVANVLKKELQ